jgi:hypothetical protein
METKGKNTGIKDIHGNPIHVGDTVKYCTWDGYEGETKVEEVSYFYPLDRWHSPQRFDNAKGFEIVKPIEERIAEWKAEAIK